MENLLTIKTFTYQHETAIVRGYLESEGIECFFKDEFTVQVDPFATNAIGGVKLQVRESDYQQAVEILKKADYQLDEEVEDTKLQKKVAGFINKIFG